MTKNWLLTLAATLFLSAMVLAETADENAKKISATPPNEQAALLIQLAKEIILSNTGQADAYASRAALLAIEYEQPEQLASAYKIRGLVGYYSNDNEMAIRFYKQALVLFEKQNNIKEASNVLNNIALAYLNKAAYEESVSFHQQALALRKKLGDTALIIASYTNLGNSFEEAGKASDADASFEKALELQRIQQPGNPSPGLLSSYGMNLAGRGNLTKAIEIFEEGIDAATKSNKYTDLITIYNNLGNIYYRLGDHEKSNNQFNKALEIVNLNEAYQMEGTILLNIGNNFDWSNQFQTAKQFYEKAYQSFTTQNDSVGMVKALVNKGLMFEKMSMTDSALAAYNTADHLGNLLQNPDLQAMCCNFLGKLYIKMNDDAKGKNYFGKALEFARKNNNINELAKTTQNLSMTYFKQKDFAKSKKFALESLELNRKNNFVAQQMENMKLLSEIEESQNNPVAALDYFKTYVVLRDSLFNLNKMEQITAIEGKFNLALKDQDLRNKTLEIQQQKELLNRTKERFAFGMVILLFVFITVLMLINRSRMKQTKNKVLAEQKQLETEHRLLRAQMNPHFMFNALNSIQSFISENNTMQAEIYLSRFARLMRYYLDSSSQSFVPFQTEIENVRLNLELEQLRLNFRFHFEIIEPEDCEDLEIPPMLAQPFIENAVRHGFRQKEENGFLQIVYEREGMNLKCTITDNGIGREAAAKNKTHNNKVMSKGISITKGRLQALFPKQNISELLKITDLYASDGKAAGTKVEFRFPYN